MNKLTLLYAEDDDETRENYTYILKEYFDTIYLATNGQEALILYKEKKPDLLLLDIGMPYLNGLDLVKTIRRKDLDTPIIMLTGHREEDKLLEAIGLKLDTYLLKPVSFSQLKSSIVKVINKIQKKSVVYLAKNLMWDGSTSHISYQQVNISLTKKERLLLNVLTTSVGTYFSQDNLILKIWYDEFTDETHDNKLIQLVYRLNKKIYNQTKYCIPHFIQNGYSLGYRLELYRSKVTS